LVSVFYSSKKETRRMNSNISISSCFNYDIKIEKQIELISEAGFKFISLSANLNHFNYTDAGERDKLKKLLSNKGISIDTIHGKALHQDKNLDFLKKTIKVAKDFNAKTIVLHVSPFYFNKENYDHYLSILIELKNDFVELVNSEKVNIALENVMPYHETDLMLEFFSQINSPYVGICYDSSHEQIDGPKDNSFLEKVHKNIFAVHLSDRIKEFVDHVIPGEGFINFNTIIEILKRSNFEGPYLFEIMMTHSKYKDPKEFLRKMYEEGSRIVEKL
jgi:sugar phosphate isomerase/epimerase